MKVQLFKAAFISVGLHALLLIPVSHSPDLMQADWVRGISSVELELVSLPPPEPSSPPAQVKTEHVIQDSKTLRGLTPVKGSDPSKQEVEQKKPAPAVPPAMDQGVITAAAPLAFQNQPPRYPWRARLRGWEGTVIVRAVVSAQGDPVSVHIRRSSGYPTLDEAAAGSVANWKFRPAKKRGRVISQAVEVPITFRLTEAETYGTE